MMIAVARLASGLALFSVAVASGQQTRDAGPTTGTAAIGGVVVAADEAGQPIRRAIVTLSGPPMIAGRSAITDDEGRFSFANLPASRYGIVASKAAYLDAAYGATRPGRPGISLALGESERQEIEVRMARGAVLEGLVRDGRGQPVPDVTVYALNTRRLVSVGTFADNRRRTFSTDDRGVFRIFGLAPGEYVVAAALPAVGEGAVGARDGASMDAVLASLRARRSDPAGALSPRPAAPEPAPATGFPLTYFPGVPTVQRAERIRVTAGAERTGLDFILSPLRTAVVSGMLVRADGQSLDGVMLSLVIEGPRSFGAGTVPTLSTAVGPDGRFEYTSVHPGHYTVYARTGVARSGNDGLVGVAEVEVTGADVTGVLISLQPGITVSGQVVFAGRVPVDVGDASGVTVRLQPGDGAWMFRSGGTEFGTSLTAPGRAVVDAGGSFAIRNVAPGRFTLSSALPPQLVTTWWLRSALYQGRDLLDGPVDIGTEDLAGVVLSYTDRRNELVGRLESAAGLPAPEYFVVVMPEARELWSAGERRIKFARPSSDGAYDIRDLPAGGYLIGALTDFEPEDLEDPAFLEQLAAQAVPVVIRNGERTVQNLRIAR